MNKKTKIVIMTVSILVGISALLGILYWGLQPVQRESVTLDKLNRKLGNRYCIPSELPFDGDVECRIVYVEGHMGVVLTRFEINPKKSTGYSIELQDANRNIRVDKGILGYVRDQERIITKNYKGQDIRYFLDNAENSWLMVWFEVDGISYQITANYDKSISNEILKNDTEFILNQMIP